MRNMGHTLEVFDGHRDCCGDFGYIQWRGLHWALAPPVAHTRRTCLHKQIHRLFVFLDVSVYHDDKLKR
jgi:hypothetical protein